MPHNINLVSLKEIYLISCIISHPDNVSALKPNTPLMWAVGTDDRMFERGEEYAFS